MFILSSLALATEMWQISRILSLSFHQKSIEWNPRWLLPISVRWINGCTNEKQTKTIYNTKCIKWCMIFVSFGTNQCCNVLQKKLIFLIRVFHFDGDKNAHTVTQPNKNKSQKGHRSVRVFVSLLWYQL